MTIEGFKPEKSKTEGPENLIELVVDNSEHFQSFDGMLARYKNERKNFEYMLEAFRDAGSITPEVLKEFNENLRVMTRQFRDDLMDYLDSRPGSLKSSDKEKIRNLSDSMESLHEEVKRDPQYPIDNESN